MASDLTLVEPKMALYNGAWEREALEETIEGLRPEWGRDIRPLMPHFVPYEIVQGDSETVFQ